MIPGYAEAVAKERAAREAAFACLPEAIEPGGFIVRPVCARHLLWLKDSPLLEGSPDLSVAEVDEALWLLGWDWWQFHRAGFTGKRPDRRAHSKRVIRLNRQGKGWDLAAGILRHFDAGMADAPPTGEGPPQKSYFSWVAGYVGLFGCEMGWSMDEVLDAPMAVLFQLEKVVALRAGSKAAMFNPSDRVITEFLNQREVERKAMNPKK